MNEDEIGKIIVDSALEVHRHLGPGLLENAYEGCLKHELELRGMRVTTQHDVPLIYKGKKNRSCLQVRSLCRGKGNYRTKVS